MLKAAQLLLGEKIAFAIFVDATSVVPTLIVVDTGVDIKEE
jgi:hypothetical protein